MKNILIHLHPDFREVFIPILNQWNQVQTEKNFVGLRPKREAEVTLLTAGAMPLQDTFPILARARTDAGYSPDDLIIGFTEKRIYESGYYQLYYGGSEEKDVPPNVTTISLDFTRKSFSNMATTVILYFK